MPDACLCLIWARRCLLSGGSWHDRLYAMVPPRAALQIFDLDSAGFGGRSEIGFATSTITAALWV